MARTTLIGLGMRVTQEREDRREEAREDTRVGSRVMSHEGVGDKGQKKKGQPG
jgi:hypothetical protein